MAHTSKAFSFAVAGLIGLLVVVSSAPAATTAERALDMDYGSFICTSVMKPLPPATPEPKGSKKKKVLEVPEAVALKGIAIRVGAADGPGQATLCFDIDRVCMTAGWTGGFVDTANTELTNHKATGYVTVVGTETFHLSGIGWGAGEKGDDFSDSRRQHLGPLPAGSARYRGLFVHGSQIVLASHVNGADVLELPGYEAESGAFTRTVRIERSAHPMTLAICDVPSGATPAPMVLNASVASVTSKGTTTSVDVVSAPMGSRLSILNGQIALSLPATTAPMLFKLRISNAKLNHSDTAVPDIAALCTGGPARWNTPVITSGRLSTQTPKNCPYVQDVIDVPDNNPWHSWMRFSGLDFFPDGRAAVCTLNGDVWIVSGLDDKLTQVTWKRFAAGLYEPMGLKVSGGDIYVRGRDQITRLHDLNNDGEADFYENFNSDGVCLPQYNSFALELQQGSDGSFYYARCAHMVPDNSPGQGYVFRVSSDGSRTEPIATGLRMANGMGAGPDDRVLVSDNEGEWTPASRINLMRFPKSGEELDFFGYVSQSQRPTPPTDYAKPLCWIPHRIDTSSGGEAPIADDRWGPYKGDWVHTSFGTASLFLLLTDESQGRDPGKAQGAVFKFPFAFDTGIMRPRFNPIDGQLYLNGVGGGWQTSGIRDGGLYRVRYTGGECGFPSRFRVVPHGVQFDFATALNKASAGDEQGWSAEQWNYRWAATYGSPDVTTKDAKKPGHDSVDVKSAQVSADRKSVTLDLPGLAPVMQLMIQPGIKSAAGLPIDWECYMTVNSVPR